MAADAAVIPPLPEGFKLDGAPALPPLPDGFKLDAPSAAVAPPAPSTAPKEKTVMDEFTSPPTPEESANPYWAASRVMNVIDKGLTTAGRWAGEHAQEAATKMGAPAEVAGAAGMVADVGTQFVAPGAAIKPARAAGSFAAKVIGNIGKKEAPQMAGFGSAYTDAATLRRQRAEALDVPIKITKGDAERTFEQQQFEKETAKHPTLGEPLRQRAAENNAKIQQNFDVWIDQTGAEAPQLRATGKAVDDALKEKMNAAKGRYQAAYAKAEKSGELAAPVATDGLVGFINENRSASKLAPIISAAEDELVRLGGASRDAAGNLVPGVLSINDTEKVRKMVVKLSKSDPTNEHYGKLANQAIDAITEGKGGDNYKYARQLYKQYADEFKSQGVIKKLVSTKPGTTDRSVALEDVFNHSVLDGSLDDLAKVHKTLTTGGESGTQAWKELQGQAMNYLKEQATKNAQRDINGNPVISFAGLDRAVVNLDKSGKLDFLFGKVGAQKVRDVRDLSADIFTAPPGSVNTSNTASALMAVLDSAFSAGTGLPAPIASSVKIVKEKLAQRKVRKKVEEALQ